jgi:hypothetical protein
MYGSQIMTRKISWSILGIFLLFPFLWEIGCTKKTVSKVDKILKADQGFQFPPGFPPDPGEAGKKTLEGIISNQDGLRDDIQRWIYARFPNEPKKRAALKQMAINYQENLLLKLDQKLLEEDIRKSSKAIACLYQVFSINDASLEREFLQAKILNTKERTMRFLEVNQWFDGMTGEGYPHDGTACEN